MARKVKHIVWKYTIQKYNGRGIVKGGNIGKKFSFYYFVFYVHHLFDGVFKMYVVMALDLEKLSDKLDDALSKETGASLKDWMNKKRMNIKFPIKIKSLEFLNNSILSGQYRSQMEVLSSIRFYMSDTFHTEKGYLAFINSFNLPLIQILINDIEADVRVRDFFMEKRGKIVQVDKIEGNKIFLSDKQEVNKNILLREYEWYPVYIQHKDDRYRAFYYALYNLILSKRASAESQVQFSLLNSILPIEERKKALEWLNIGDQYFNGVLSENGVF